MLEEEHNPYAPPAAPSVEPRRRRRKRRRTQVNGGSLKWIFLGISSVEIVLVALTYVIPYSKDYWDLVNGLSAPLAIARSGLGLSWLYRSWSDIPKEQQDTQRVTPWRAVYAHFIPLVNLAWIFSVQKRLCMSMNALLASREKKALAPVQLALLAPAFHLFASATSYTKVPEAVFSSRVISCAVWFAYMLLADRARGALVAALAPKRARA